MSQNKIQGRDLEEVVYHEDKSGNTVADRTLLIPKIIHQTYKTQVIPEKWREAQESIQEFNPDYEYIMWTDEKIHDFIAEHYAWYLPTFENYRYPIMRVDAARYFILYHYGGIYLDLDIGAKAKFDPLLAFPAWLSKTDPTGVSNDMMGSMPGHSFFGEIIVSLQRYNRNWFVPYATVMYSTGSLFVSVILQKFSRSRIIPENDRVFIIYQNENGVRRFFYHLDGSSWHRDDAGYLHFIWKHWILALCIAILVVIGFFYCELKLCQYLLAGRPSRLQRCFRSLRRFTNKSKENIEAFVGGDYDKTPKATDFRDVRTSKEQWDMA